MPIHRATVKLRRARHTINSLALGEVGVVLASEESISVATDDAFDIAARDVVEHPFSHFGWIPKYLKLVWKRLLHILWMQASGFNAKR
jgi:hypothetical protein